MAYTYSKIASYTVGSGGVSSIDFIAIPQNYTDLLLKVSGRVAGTGTGTQLRVQFNSSGGTAYSDRLIEGTGSSVISASRSGNAYMYLLTLVQGGGGAYANTWGNGEIYIPNYTGSTNKSVSMDGVTENNGTLAYVEAVAGLWANTAAITSINLTSQDASNFVQYSTATLYGIKAEL